MCLSLRYTDSLGRSCVPETLLRTAHFRRCNRTAFFCCLSMFDQPSGASVVFEAPAESFVKREDVKRESGLRSRLHVSRLHAYFAPAPANALPGLILTTSPS